MPRPELHAWQAAYNCLDFLERNNTPGSIYALLVTSEEARYIAWTLATLTPFEQLPDDPPLRSGRPAPPLLTQAAREGFKAPNKLCSIITAAHAHRLAILKLKDLVKTQGNGVRERDRFGMAIREWDTRGGGGNWRLQVLYALLVDVAERVGGQAVVCGERPESQEMEDVLREWQAFLDHLIDLDVMDAPSIKRLVDGNMLTKALGVRPGRWMGAALDVALAWQLRNPGVTNPSGAIEEVIKKRDELGIN